MERRIDATISYLVGANYSSIIGGFDLRVIRLVGGFGSGRDINH